MTREAEQQAAPTDGAATSAGAGDPEVGAGTARTGKEMTPGGKEVVVPGLYPRHQRTSLAMLVREVRKQQDLGDAALREGRRQEALKAFERALRYVDLCPYNSDPLLKANHLDVSYLQGRVESLRLK